LPAQPVPIERMMARSQNGKTLGGRDLEVIDVGGLEAPRAPEPPEGLGDRGSVEWRKIWQAGKWLWPDQDYAWVEQCARAYDDLAVFRAKVAEDGLTVEGYNGQTTAHPLISEMRKCEDTIRKCLSQLGFSPTDRARLKLTELKGASELQKLVNGGTQSSAPGNVVESYVEGEW
jgi:P27 family predicted phage terminase small subunit